MVSAEQRLPSILIVEDDPSQALLMRASLKSICDDLTHADSTTTAISALTRRDFDLMLLDLNLPDGSGIAIQEWLNARISAPAVVVVTADDLAERVVEAMRLGAQDYVVKRPNYLQSLSDTVSQALEHMSTEPEDSSVTSAERSQPVHASLIGRSRPMRQVRDRIEKYGGHDATVLITGETGTGKELVARAIHDSSARAEGPFIAVNCAAINGSLFESELFGSVRGAFTGAVRDRGGLLRAAERGTIFLDEIGELPLEAQAKLLRVLEEGSYRPVGDVGEVEADVRILAATNRRLLDEVKAGRFRSDLYYRLDVLQLHVPPMRERLADLPLLVEHFVRRESKGGAVARATDAALETLRMHAWPGNVRELRHVVTRSLLWSEGGVIGHFDIRLEESESSDDGRMANNRRSLGWNEIAERLKESEGRLGPAAAALEISTRTLQRRMRDLGMNTRDFR